MLLPKYPGHLAYVLMAMFILGKVGSVRAQDKSEAPARAYRQRAALGIKHLQSWYDPRTGLYTSTGWWNAANAVTTLADYSRVTGDHQYDEVFASVFVAAQHKFPKYLNNFYDDEGWWALAWIDAYDLTHRREFLQMAELIFEDMAKGWDDTCSGGIWWSKDRKYKNAIANELFLSVAAHLAARTENKKDRAKYLGWARREWQWFSQTGMINSSHQINDGLDAHCKNNHQTTWTYNQGVVLGGLGELSRTTEDKALLDEANAIAQATFANQKLVDAHGILHDPCEPDCGEDGTQFKGIFMRNLAALQQLSPSPRYEHFILANADSVWSGMHSPEYGIGAIWAAPWGVVNASTQSSGEDALVAAVAVLAR
jgi:predicted alpha-1,6-mannanase (GH76 family)